MKHQLDLKISDESISDEIITNIIAQYSRKIIHFYSDRVNVRYDGNEANSSISHFCMFPLKSRRKIVYHG